MSRLTSKRERAQSLVELALLLPALLLLTVGVVDLGRAFYESIAIHGAAEAGSMVAIEWRRADPADLTPANNAVKAAVKASSNPDIFPFLQILDSEIDVSGIPWSAGSEYTITVNHNFRLLTPLVGNVLAGGQNLTLRSVIRGRHSCPC